MGVCQSDPLTTIAWNALCRVGRAFGPRPIRAQAHWAPPIWAQAHPSPAHLGPGPFEPRPIWTQAHVGLGVFMDAPIWARHFGQQGKKTKCMPP